MMAGDLFGERESDLAILSAIETRIAAAHARYGDFASTHEALGVAVEEWDELLDAIRAAIVRAAGPNWRSLAKEPFPGCKTPDGCRANGCLGWCDEYLPTTTVSTGQKHSSWHPAHTHSGAHPRDGVTMEFSSIEAFEVRAEAFRIMTGHMAPGATRCGTGTSTRRL